MRDLQVIGVRVSAQRFEAAIDTLIVAAERSVRLRAHFATVHSIVEASRDPKLREVFASAGMVATDGIPLVWVARWRGARAAERVCGPDVMVTLCHRGRASGLRHYFLGGRPGVPDQLAHRLAAQLPGLNVVGTNSPPFRRLTAQEDAALVDEINSAAPDVLWIGLGSPKQDIWAADHENALRASLILPVGAAFDFHSGRLRRAPRWMQGLGLEWVFRLAMEPRRLAARYLFANVQFLWLLIREEVAGRRWPL